jgi:hypothetical protein
MRLPANLRVKLADPQAKRLYAADRRFDLYDRGTPVVGTTIPDCQVYVDALLRRKSIRKMLEQCNTWGARQVLKNGIIVEACHGSNAVIRRYQPLLRLSPTQYSVGPILHEIAHFTTFNSSQGGNGALWVGKQAPHGPDFAAIALKLFRMVMGREYAEKLQASYNLHRVEVMGQAGIPAVPSVPASQIHWHRRHKGEMTSRGYYIKGFTPRITAKDKIIPRY